MPQTGAYTGVCVCVVETDPDPDCLLEKLSPRPEGINSPRPHLEAPNASHRDWLEGQKSVPLRRDAYARWERLGRPRSCLSPEAPAKGNPSVRLLLAPGTKARQAVRAPVGASIDLPVWPWMWEKVPGDESITEELPQPAPAARTPAGQLAPGRKGCGSRPPPRLGAEPR